MGAYYTKEDITEYIGKNTILPFLFDSAKKSCRVAFEGRTSRREAHSKPDASTCTSAACGSPSPGGEGRGEGERLSPIRDLNDLITLNLDIRQFTQDVVEHAEGPDLLRAFWHAIEKVTVLDSTSGSGAFLFAALNILEPLYEACLDRMKAFVEDLDRY